MAESLLSTDRVALEVTGGSREIARLLEPHVKRVIVVSPEDTGISQARAKTDRLDARALARLLWTGELEAVWMPPEWIARSRRRLAPREQLVRARSRVNVICAAIFLAAVGDIRRFNGSRKVVAYLGLDPRVYQPGSGPTRGGRISKQGSLRARWALVEPARPVAQQPGPMHAFYERIKARKGHNAAVVAVARKLAVLFYLMLTREQIPEREIVGAADSPETEARIYAVASVTEWFARIKLSGSQLRFT